MALLHPESLNAETIVFGIFWIETSNPFLDRRHHNIRRPIVQLAASAVPCPQFVLPQLLEQLRFRFPELRDRFDQLFLGVHQAIDPATLVVAIRIALRVLHVTNERVVPIAKPESTIRTDLWINRPE